MKKRNPNKKKIRKLVKCSNCKKCKWKYDDEINSVKYLCKETNKQMTKEDKDKERICGMYKSKYIEFPIYTTVVKYHNTYEKGIEENSKTGKLVKIRPCNDKYRNKTFLGIYLGDADIGMNLNFNRDTKELEVIRSRNPAIFVPDLKKIVYGVESYWGEIKTENDLKDITNNDIENIWYIKALKNVCDKKENI